MTYEEVLKKYGLTGENSNQQQQVSAPAVTTSHVPGSRLTAKELREMGVENPTLLARYLREGKVSENDILSRVQSGQKVEANRIDVKDPYLQYYTAEKRSKDVQKIYDFNVRAGEFAKEVQELTEKGGYLVVSEDLISRGKKLEEEYKEIARYVRANARYLENAEQLEGLASDLTKGLEILKELKDYYGSFGNEEEYNKAVAASSDIDYYTRRDAALAYNVEKGQEEVNQFLARMTSSNSAKSQLASIENYLIYTEDGSDIDWDRTANETYAGIEYHPDRGFSRMSPHQLKNTYYNLLNNLDERSDDKSAWVKEWEDVKSEHEYRTWLKKDFQYDMLSENADFIEKSNEGERLTGGKIPGEKTDEMRSWEKSTYYYIYATDGEKAAKEYVKHLKNTLRERRGADIARFLETRYFNGAASSIYGLFTSMVDKVRDVGEWFTDLDDAAWDYANDKLQESHVLDDTDKWFHRASMNIGGMIPGMALKAVNPVLGWAFEAASNYGSSEQEARKMGLTKSQQIKYGLLMSAGETAASVVTDKIFGTVGLDDAAVNKKIATLGKAWQRVGLKLASKVGSEEIEELSQEIFWSPAVTSMLTGEDFTLPNAEQILETVAMTALSTLILGAPGDVKTEVKTQQNYKAVGQSLIDSDKVGNLKNTTLSKMVDMNNPDFRATNRLYKGISDSAEGLSKRGQAAKVGQLYTRLSQAEAVNNASEDRIDISHQLQQKGYEPNKAKAIADALVAQNTGQELTREQRKTLKEYKSDEVVNDIVEQIWSAGKGNVGQDTSVSDIGRSARDTLAKRAAVTAAPAGEPPAVDARPVSETTEAPTSVDTAADESVVTNSPMSVYESTLAMGTNAAADPVAEATTAFTQNGTITDKQIQDILNSTTALDYLRQQTGIPIKGTPEERRNAVRQAVAMLAQKQAEVDSSSNLDIASGNAPEINSTGKVMAGELSTNAISKPLEAYPAEKQRTIMSYINAVDQKLKDFVHRVKSGDLRFSRQKISDVSNRAAKDISNLLGIDVSGYSNNINTNGLQHILIRHGQNGEHDSTMSMDDDIARVAWVLDNYDKVELIEENGVQSYSGEFRDQNNNPAPQIKFTKKIDGTYYVVEAVCENKYKKLWVQGTYLQKNEDVTQAPAEGVSTNHETNAQGALASPSSKTSIPQTPPVVNTISETSADSTETDTPSPTESVGAAPAGFDPYSELQFEHGNKPDRAGTVRDINVPNRDTYGKRVSDYAANLEGNRITKDEMVDRLHTLTLEGAFGEDTRHLSEYEDYAVEQVGKNSTKAYGEVMAAVKEGKSSPELLAVAQVLYAEAQIKGDFVAAGEIAVMAADLARNAGRTLNVAKMTASLTPDGQLAARLAMAENANKAQQRARPNKKTKEVKISEKTQQDFKDVANAGETVVTDVKDTLNRTAKRDITAAAEDAAKEAKPKTPAEIGDAAGEAAGKRAKRDAGSTSEDQAVPSETELYNSIMEFIKSKTEKTKRPAKKKALNALVNYYKNSDEFTEAWTAARRRAEAEIGDDPKAYEMLRQFLDTGAMAQDTMDSSDPKSVSGRALREAATGAGVNLQSLIAKSAQDKDAAFNEIRDYVMSEYELDDAAAEKLTKQLQDTFFESLARRQSERLIAMFGEKNKPAEKSKQTDRVMEKFRELYNMGAFTKDAFISREALRKLFGADGLTLSEEVLNEYGKASDARKAAIDQQIISEIAEQLPGDLRKSLNKWRYSAMLLNPSTHLKNITGNTGMFILQHGVKDTIQTLIETGVYYVGGKKLQRTKAFLNPLSKADQQLVTMAFNDYGSIFNNSGEVAEAIRNGGKRSDAQTEIEQQRRVMKITKGGDSKLKSTVNSVLYGVESTANANSTAMDTEDAVFGKLSYAICLAEYMKANNLTEITNEARESAIAQAREVTFHDDSWIYEHVKGIKNTAVGDVVVPYVKTPANVTARAVEYSPLSILQTAFDILRLSTGKTVKKNGKTVTGADAINHLSKGIVGSSLYAAGAWLAAQGIIRVVGAGSEEKREYEKLMGAKDFSIYIGDKPIDADFMIPAILPIFTGGAIYETAVNASEGKATWKDVVEAVYSVTDPILSSSMMSSLDGFMYAIRKMDNPSTGELLGTLVTEYCENLISQFIPSVLKRGVAAEDNIRRETYADPDNPLSDIWQGIKMNFPGQRDDLKPKRDIWGNPIKENQMGGDGILGWAVRTATPTKEYDVHSTAIDEELIRLAEADYKAWPTARNSTTITINGEKVRLTQDQYDTYEAIEGQTAFRLAEKLINSDLYKHASDEVRSKLLEDAYSYADEVGKHAAVSDYKMNPPTYLSSITDEDAVVNAILQNRASYGITSALSNATKAWKEGKDNTQSVADLDSAWKNYQQMSPEMQEAVLSEGGRVKDYITARQKGISTESFVATYKTDNALSSLSSGWKKGENSNQTTVDQLESSWDAIKGLSAEERKKVIDNAEGRTKEYFTARQKGFTAEEFVGSYRTEYTVTNSFSDLTSSWKEGKDNAEAVTNLDSAWECYKKLPAHVKSNLKSKLSGRQLDYITARENGISAKVFTDLYKTYYDLNNDKSQTAKEKASAWSLELERARANGKITTAQRDVLKNDMYFNYSFRAETERFDGFVEKGIPAETASYVDDLLNDLIPEKGKTAVSNIQKIETVANADSYLTESQQQAAMEEILPETYYAKYQEILKLGMDTDDYAKSYRIYLEEADKGGKGVKARTIEEIQKALRIPYDEAKKLYEIYKPPAKKSS